MLRAPPRLRRRPDLGARVAFEDLGERPAPHLPHAIINHWRNSAAVSLVRGFRQQQFSEVSGGLSTALDAPTDALAHLHVEMRRLSDQFDRHPDATKLRGDATTFNAVFQLLFRCTHSRSSCPGRRVRFRPARRRPRGVGNSIASFAGRGASPTAISGSWIAKPTLAGLSNSPTTTVHVACTDCGHRDCWN